MNVLLQLFFIIGWGLIILPIYSITNEIYFMTEQERKLFPLNYKSITIMLLVGIILAGITYDLGALDG